MATKKKRLTVSVTDEMYRQIEDFRYENRYPTGAAATKELIRIGLKLMEPETKLVDGYPVEKEPLE